MYEILNLYKEEMVKYFSYLSEKGIDTQIRREAFLKKKFFKNSDYNTVFKILDILN